MVEREFIQRIYSLPHDELGRPQVRSTSSKASKIKCATLLPYAGDGRTRIEVLFELGGPPNSPNVQHPFAFIILPKGTEKNKPWFKLELDTELIIDGKAWDVFVNL